MSETSIEWTDKTWNPTRGCSRVSPGCDNCYAMRVAHRFSGPGKPYEGLTRIGKRGVDWSGVVRLVPEMLDAPLRWRKPRRVFVNSMSDLFHESLTSEDIAAVFGVMAACPQHTFQVLTKRAKRMRDWFEWVGQENLDTLRACSLAHLRGRRVARGHTWPLPNVWLGVSAEDQQRADERIPHLLATPAAVRFVSAEPLLGPVDFDRIGNALFNREANVRKQMARGLNRDQAESYIAHPQLDWVIVGGESGAGARTYDLRWPRDIIRQCREAGVPVFHKQLGSRPLHDWEALPDKLIDRKGGEPSEWPEDLRVREWPEVRR